MLWYEIAQTLQSLDCEPAPDSPAVVLLTSEELSQKPILSGLSDILCHTPSARDARVCKAEARSSCLAGTLILPHTTKRGVRPSYGLLVTRTRVVLVDDTETLQSHLKHLTREKHWMGGHIGRFLYELLDQLTAKDLHYLEEIEDQIEALEEDVLSGRQEHFSSAMTDLRKAAMARFRYYSQLDDVAAKLLENENGFFTEEDQPLFHLFEDRVCRLREESQLLREYCAQVQAMFQAEIDIHQNRIMQILTIVTTIFLPLSLLVGWYGMNFVGMRELTWDYGYPAVIVVSLIIVAVSLWICKKKKFW